MIISSQLCFMIQLYFTIVTYQYFIQFVLVSVLLALWQVTYLSRQQTWVAEQYNTLK